MIAGVFPKTCSTYTRGYPNAPDTLHIIDTSLFCVVILRQLVCVGQCCVEFHYETALGKPALLVLAITKLRRIRGQNFPQYS